MHSSSSAAAIDRLVEGARDLRALLIESANDASPSNLAGDGVTTVQAALLDLRFVLDAFLAKGGPDDEITGEQSTE